MCLKNVWCKTVTNLRHVAVPLCDITKGSSLEILVFAHTFLNVEPAEVVEDNFSLVSYWFLAEKIGQGPFFSR